MGPKMKNRSSFLNKKFSCAKMAKLSLIDFKIGLPINPYVNDGQNKLEVDI